jgi:hypothetical protein
MNGGARHGRIVRMRHPEDMSRMIDAGVSQSTITKLWEDERWSALGDYVVLLWEQSILEIPDSIFQGLNRPFGGTESDTALYAYHKKAGFSWTFDGVDPRRDPPQQIAAPLHSLFTAFVNLDESVIRDTQAGLGSAGGSVEAVVTRWEWTPASPFTPGVPVDHDRRYRRRVWLRV